MTDVKLTEIINDNLTEEPSDSLIEIIDPPRLLDGYPSYLKDYQILAFVNSGSYGNVLQAVVTDKSSSKYNCSVALKAMDPDMALQELLAIMTAGSHNNIVKCYGLFIDEEYVPTDPIIKEKMDAAQQDRVKRAEEEYKEKVDQSLLYPVRNAYLVFDLYQGSVNTFKKNIKLYHEDHVKLVQDLASAIKHLHDNNLLHLDISWGNILFQLEDSPENKTNADKLNIAKWALTDFGFLAKAFSSPSKELFNKYYQALAEEKHKDLDPLRKQEIEAIKKQHRTCYGNGKCGLNTISLPFYDHTDNTEYHRVYWKYKHRPYKSLPDSKLIYGAYYYRAPETFTGKFPLVSGCSLEQCKKLDVWSLGVVLDEDILSNALKWSYWADRKYLDFTSLKNLITKHGVDGFRLAGGDSDDDYIKKTLNTIDGYAFCMARLTQPVLDFCIESHLPKDCYLERVLKACLVIISSKRATIEEVLAIQ